MGRQKFIWKNTHNSRLAGVNTVAKVWKHPTGSLYPTLMTTLSYKIYPEYSDRESDHYGTNIRWTCVQRYLMLDIHLSSFLKVCEVIEVTMENINFKLWLKKNHELSHSCHLWYYYILSQNISETNKPHLQMTILQYNHINTVNLIS